MTDTKPIRWDNLFAMALVFFVLWLLVLPWWLAAILFLVSGAIITGPKKERSILFEIAVQVGAVIAALAVIAAMLWSQGASAATNHEPLPPPCQLMKDLTVEVGQKMVEIQTNAEEDAVRLDIGCKRMRENYQPFLDRSIESFEKMRGTCPLAPEKDLQGMIDHLKNVKKAGEEVAKVCEKGGRS